VQAILICFFAWLFTATGLRGFLPRESGFTKMWICFPTCLLQVKPCLSYSGHSLQGCFFNGQTMYLCKLYVAGTQYNGFGTEAPGNAQ
jgi:hypothetical protein